MNQTFCCCPLPEITVTIRWPTGPHLSYLYIKGGKPMAITTTINITAGGPAEQVQVVAQDGTTVLPTANVSWGAPSDTNVTITAAADGKTWLFAASAAIGASETVISAATYSGPMAPAPVVGPMMTINVSVQATTVTALQYNDLGPVTPTP